MHFEVNGKRAFASTGGKAFDNSKPVVIFLNGSGLDHTFWGLHSRFFAFRKYSVICPDYPGHSHSDGPALGSIEEIGAWINDVTEELGANNISVVAHSQGCLIALEYASRFPDRIRSVSFVASGLATPVNAALINAAENDPEAAISMMVGWGFGAVGHLHQGAIPGNSMIAGGRKVMGWNVPTGLATDLKACDAYKNGRQAAAAIKLPRQVVLAGKDRMASRKAGMELVEYLDGPECTIIEDSGHMIPQEAPNRLRKLLKGFVFTNNPA